MTGPQTAVGVVRYRFVIPGRPVPAVRMTQRSKHVSPQAKRYLAYKQLVGWTAQQAGVTPIEGPVSIRIELFLTEPVKRRYDLDNVVKAIVDSLPNIGFTNDRQMVHLEAWVNMKSADDDYTLVELVEVPDDYDPDPTGGRAGRQ